jgi:hypothetical protein
MEELQRKIIAKLKLETAAHERIWTPDGSGSYTSGDFIIHGGGARVAATLRYKKVVFNLPVNEIADLFTFITQVRETIRQKELLSVLEELREWAES